MRDRAEKIKSLDISDSHALKRWNIQFPRRVNAPKGMRADIAEIGGVGSLSRADAIQHDQKNAPYFHISFPR